jgi:hypothetical protein
MNYRCLSLLILEQAVLMTALQDLHAAASGGARAGVEFIDENGGGAGVRLRKRQGEKSPKNK